MGRRGREVVSSEVGKHEASETTKPNATRIESSLFDRIDNRMELAFSNAFQTLEKVFDPDERADVLFTSPDYRIECANRTSKEYMQWDGSVGDSVCRPNLETEQGRKVAKALESYGQDGVEYRNGVVDFSKCSAETVVISDMKDSLPYNYKQAIEAVAAKWNSEAKDGRTDWTPKDVKAWKAENDLEFHECSDMRTCQFVPKPIHQACRHSGGRAECGFRDGTRGAFDE